MFKQGAGGYVFVLILGTVLAFGCTPADSPATSDVPIATADSQAVTSADAHLPTTQPSSPQTTIRPSTSSAEAETVETQSLARTINRTMNQSPIAPGKGAVQPARTTRPNLLENGSFDQGPADELQGWKWWRDHVVSRYKGDPFETSLRIFARPGQEVAFVQPIADVLKPGQTYELSGYAMTDNPGGRAVLELVTENGEVIESSNAVTASNWKPVSLRFATGDHKSNWMVSLRYRLDPDAEKKPSTIWFAKLKLVASDK